MRQTLKVLHTSDWHLGKRLYGQNRYSEFLAFLNWLYHCIVEQSVDVLIVAGDVFDTMTPSNKAQNLYYDFLGKVAQSQCQHVIIVAGNHDSPSLLDAPKNILKFINVHIVGTACANIEEEVITLTDRNSQPQAIILAVPYLRDKDVRDSVSAESSDDKNKQLIEGIKRHYAQATEIAKQKQQVLANSKSYIPIIATGHLMALGGKMTDDDGVRDLYVGSLGGISANIFDDAIDYVALGHLHVPQIVGGCEHIRYSGSPIPMGFGEATQQKQVLMVNFDTDSPTNHNPISHSRPSLDIESIPIPCFHKLAQIKGDFVSIEKALNQLKTLNQAVWVEVIYQSDKIISNLNEQLQERIKGSDIEIIKIKNPPRYQQVLNQALTSEALQDLSYHEVFERCLEMNNIPDTQRVQLIDCFQQIVHDIHHEDFNAK